jgi:hypothetical protein
MIRSTRKYSKKRQRQQKTAGRSLFKEQTMLTKADLDQFIGTQNYYRTMLPRFVFTDGVKFMADEAGAYWLIDAIGSYQPQPRLRNNEQLRYFQVWELKLDGKGGAVLTCRADTDVPPVVTQKIPYTDFPFDIKLWVERGDNMMVLLLPSEH